MSGTGAEPVAAGPVTLLFSDVERSSLHWIHREREMPVFIPALNQLIEAEGVERGGEVIGREGDGRSLLFTEPLAAVETALEIQRRLVGDPEPTGHLMVRIGLHSGPLLRLSDGDLGGTTVNYVGRMHKAGHGGQTILSDVTRHQVEGILPTHCHLTDLGIHNIRDFEPERLWQLVHPSLPQSFPLLNTPRRYEAPQPRLPVFVGRDSDLATIESLLDTALITITGPGGIGKTRLARQLIEQYGHRFPDGVCYVDLHELARHDDVYGVVCNALGVDPAQEMSPETSIAAALTNSRTLVVLDSAELVRPAVACIAAATSAQHGPTLLVTSRVPLNVEGECVYPLLPLPVMSDRSDDGARTVAPVAGPALKLFVARAKEVRADFDLSDSDQPLAIKVCELLDGFPLAIELVAAWTRVMSITDILDRIGAELELAESRTDDNQSRSMHAAIDWSVDHLEPNARQLLADLARFHPGARAKELQQVLELDISTLFSRLDGLAERALIRVDRGNEPYRYQLLEPLRPKARRSAAATGGSAFTSLHSRTYLDLAIAAEPQLKSENEIDAVRTLTADLGNIRLAIDNASQSDEVELAAQALYALHEFSFLRMNYELYSWVERLLKSEGISYQSKAQLLSIAALGAFNRGDIATSEQLGIKSQTTASRAGNDPPIHSCFALIAAFGIATDFEKANEQFQLALDWTADHNEPYFKVNSLVLASMAMTSQGAPDVAADLSRNALATAEDMGNPSSVAWSLAALGDSRRLLNPILAKENLDSAIRIARRTSANWIVGQALLNLAGVERHSRDVTSAAHSCIAALAHCQQINNPIQSRQATRLAFLILCDLDCHQSALRLLDSVRQGSATIPPAPDLSQDISDAMEACEAKLSVDIYDEARRRGQAPNDRAAIVAGRVELQIALAR